MSDCRWGWDWCLDLLTTCTHSSLLQVIMAPPLISTLHQWIAHNLSSQSACTSRFLVTNHNNGDSSASALTSLLFGWYCTKLVAFITPWHGSCRTYNLFPKPLLNNGCHIFAYSAIVTQQRIYMLQYFDTDVRNVIYSCNMENGRFTVEFLCTLFVGDGVKRLPRTSFVNMQDGKEYGRKQK
jgi:hypothetical protein